MAKHLFSFTYIEFKRLLGIRLGNEGTRGRSSNCATCLMEPVAAMVNGFILLIIVAKSSILNMVMTLFPPKKSS